MTWKGVKNMKRIIIHWTAGTNYPCSTDLEHYHYLIDKDGKLYNGKYKPEDNEDCTDKKYAQHCGGGNTGAIGISLCGMYVPTGVAVQKTKYPLTAVQCERAFKLIAELAKKYNIAITSDNIMTHYEFGKKNPKTSSYGKIDIIYLPPYTTITANKMGDFIRGKVRWYYEKI
jgi:N-acetyl-anhydromuramyl-L-alanine amidase AmpD